MTASRGMNILITAACACVVGALGGCNIVGPVAYIVGGPPKVDAEFTLPDRPTVVYVDDRQNLISPSGLRRVMADRASSDLMEHKALTETISSRDAMALVTRQDRHSDLIPIDQIGRDVGAEQVIYVEVLSFRDSPDNYTPRPMGSCSVRVIDVTNRVRLYPAEGEQPRVLQVAMRAVSTEMYRSRATRSKLRQALAEEMGSHIAKLFYRHEKTELGGNLKPR